MTPRELVEKLAELEHEQWMEWSKSVASEVSPERYARWQKLWIPYAQLSEAEKDKDREYAMKSMQHVMAFTDVILDKIDKVANGK